MQRKIIYTSTSCGSTNISRTTVRSFQYGSQLNGYQFQQGMQYLPQCAASNTVTTFQNYSSQPIAYQMDQQDIAEQDVPSSNRTLPQNSDDGSWSKFQLDCLTSHNKYRALHGCPALKLNRELCDYATEWAKHLGAIRQLQHRQSGSYGENIYCSSGFDPSAADAVKSWYDEIRMYNFSSGNFSGNTGHFTQVVWRGSKEVGVGKAKVGRDTYVVCNYNPAGNMMGQFGQNVPRPL